MRSRKDIRLKNYDYTSNGYYFVTVASKLRRHLFTEKPLIEAELSDLINSIEGLKLDYFVIMPNHMHLILVLENCKLKLGEIVRRFKAKVSHKMQDNVWQANYYEHVIRNDKALDKIREYIINNPQAELLKFEKFYK